MIDDWNATRARSWARWIAHYPGWPDWESFSRNAASWRSFLEARRPS